MAWTALTYAFQSILTSAKMTQNQANFQAMADGDSGAPRIKKAAMDSTAPVAWKNEANVFSNTQKVDANVVAFSFNAPNGAQATVVQSSLASTNKWNLVVAPTEPSFKIQDGGGIDRVTFNLTNGKMINGIVPLERMGTVILDSTTAVAADTVTTVALSIGADISRFYLMSIRGPGTDFWTTGANVGASETVAASTHSFIQRSSSPSFSDALVLVNGTSVTKTAVYKVYSLTEI